MGKNDTIKEVNENLENVVPNITAEDNVALNKNLNNEYKQKQNRILIFGVGGGGSNSVERMYKNNLQGVEFLIANTDFKDLQNKTVPYILMGKNTTAGNGAGRDPEIGKQAAEESIEEIREKLEGVSLVFLVTYLGGGTGTGATPVIARLAKEMGILVIAMVTKPPRVEGEVIMRYSIEGINELKKDTGTLIVIPMDNLDRVVNRETKMIDAHEKIIDFISMSIKSITDLITTASETGYINLDLADVRTNMKTIGKTMMGFGEAEGENRAIEAVEEAIHNPLLDNISIRGTKSIIVNITTSNDIGYLEVMRCREKILEEVDNPDALIITGHVIDQNMDNKLRVSIFATGIGVEEENNNRKKTIYDFDNWKNRTINDNVVANINNNFNEKDNTPKSKIVRKKIGEDNDDYDEKETDTEKTFVNKPQATGKVFDIDEPPAGYVPIEEQYKAEIKKWDENRINNGIGRKFDQWGAGGAGMIDYNDGSLSGTPIYSEGQMKRMKEESQKKLEQLQEKNNKKKKGGFFSNLFGGGKKNNDNEEDIDEFQMSSVEDYDEFSSDVDINHL